MTEFIYSAHELCTTRLCQAANCESDAETGWALCERHDRQAKRGHPVTLNTTPTPQQPQLRCSTCNTWKPDNHFPHLTPQQANATGRKPSRRGRYCNCNACMKRPSYKPKTNA